MFRLKATLWSPVQQCSAFLLGLLDLWWIMRLSGTKWR